jgi:hypothetical protein
MLAFWQHVRFANRRRSVKHVYMSWGVFDGQSSQLQRDYHGAPCAFNKVLPHN